MISIRVLAAAVLASSGLMLSTPALAAPKTGAALAPWANAIVLVKEKHRDRNWSNNGGTDQWRRRDGRRDGDQNRTGRDDGRRSTDGDRTRAGRDDRQRGTDGDRSHARRTDRDWRRDDRRDDRRDYRNGDRGKHYGWDRGNHYGWDKGDKRKRWRSRQHPRRDYYVGRRFPRVQYVIIDRYNDYYLPPPRRGHYYARIDNDVYLVAEATKLIIDAFVLLDAAGN